MPPLEFDFEDLLAEIGAIGGVASDFIEVQSKELVLPRLARDLEMIRTFPQGTPYPWAITDAMPLRTQVSPGGYERDDGGEHNVFGEITSIWTVAPADPNSTKKRPARILAVVGNASVCIRIKETRPNGVRELAMWRVELGADDAPGCFFHTQVLADKGRNHPPFPHSLSVPRLPALVFTPSAALEFVIGELFQDAWRRHALVESRDMNRWKTIQRLRFMRLLEWKHARVRDCVGSPWAALKKSLPPAKLFLVEEDTGATAAMPRRP